MKIAYIDSSFLLSIIFEDENYEFSLDTWNGIDVHLSSVLLDVECFINLDKVKKHEKSLSEEWLAHKNKELENLISCINRKNLDSDVLDEIKNNNSLKKLKALDSIHLATANIYQKFSEENILLCTYDKNMQKVGLSLGFGILYFF